MTRQRCRHIQNVVSLSSPWQDHLYRQVSECAMVTHDNKPWSLGLDLNSNMAIHASGAANLRLSGSSTITSLVHMWSRYLYHPQLQHLRKREQPPSSIISLKTWYSSLLTNYGSHHWVEPAKKDSVQLNDWPEPQLTYSQMWAQRLFTQFHLSRPITQSTSNMRQTK